ncbi:hypothetical protein [uncultured Reyranella sp.]|uniref:hypothetical protein n=1 Tax=uncultured Reyranella sp. TaxID=735512 RepID=UPI0025DF08AF|nr:hypothetical protein [uncultured Reyranella sp.]
MRAANDNDLALPDLSERLRDLAMAAADRLSAISEYGDAAFDAVFRRERQEFRNVVRGVEIVAMQMDVAMMQRFNALQNEKLQALRAQAIALGIDPDNEATWP